MTVIAFSVVIPLYNKRAHIRRTVESVLTQDHDAFEVIVVDDGSTDGGAETLADIADPRIRIVRQDNAWVAAARNRGIEAARNQWIALLDGDDLWRPNHLSELAKAIAAYPDSGMVSTKIDLIWNGDVRLAPQTGPSAIREIDYFAAASRNVHVVTSSSVAMRRDRLLQIGGFHDHRPGEDIDCWVRMALAWPVVHSDRATACYIRATGGQMDAWVAPRIGQKSREIRTVEGFGGTVKQLHEALETGKYEDRRRSIERYMDARILSNARKSLTWGDSTGARQRLRFVHNKVAKEYLMYRLLALLPDRAMTGGIAAFRRVRSR